MSTEPLPSLSPALAELVDGVLGWLIAKIEAREGFSALMVSRHADGTQASHYHGETVEEAIGLALGDLTTRLAGAGAYALAYDARVRTAEGDRPAFLCRVEERGMPRAHEVVLFYDLDEGEGSRTVRAERHLRPTGRTFEAALGG